MPLGPTRPMSSTSSMRPKTMRLTRPRLVNPMRPLWQTNQMSSMSLMRPTNGMADKADELNELDWDNNIAANEAIVANKANFANKASM